jgi:hypothetical protein
MRTIGERPMPIAPFREYLYVVKELLDGNEVEFAHTGRPASPASRAPT